MNNFMRRIEMKKLLKFVVIVIILIAILFLFNIIRNVVIINKIYSAEKIYKDINNCKTEYLNVSNIEQDDVVSKNKFIITKLGEKTKIENFEYVKESDSFRKITTLIEEKIDNKIKKISILHDTKEYSEYIEEKDYELPRPLMFFTNEDYLKNDLILNYLIKPIKENSSQYIIKILNEDDNVEYSYYINKNTLFMDKIVYEQDDSVFEKEYIIEVDTVTENEFWFDLTEYKNINENN